MSEQQARPAGTRSGIDAYQSRARAAAGYDIPRSRPKESPAVVAGIVAVTCEHCGCTSAKVRDCKPAPCPFCGKKPRPVFGLAEWTKPMERLLNDRKAAGGDS